MGLSDFFIRVLCIGSVLLYAASASLITQPQVQFSPVVVSKLLQLKNNKTSEYQVTTVHDRYLMENLSARVNALESLFRIVGEPELPITIAIDRDHPLRVSVGATDIIIGSRAALAKSQLEHALIKAWIRQVGSSEVLNNPLKVEIYSDLITALYSGGLNLQDPENLKIAEFGDTATWVDDLQGTAQLCKSAWRPAELISYCMGATRTSNNSQTSYSLRSVVGSLIWIDLKQHGLLEKRATLANFSRNIRSDRPSTVALSELEGVERLRSSIEAEAREIYPELVAGLPSITPSIGLLKEKELSLVGGFEITSYEAPLFKKVIIESCAAPTLKQLMAKTSEATEHILLVQNCESKQVDYSGFAISGIARFARENLSVQFAYLHRPSLKLAAKMIDGFQIESALASDSADPSTDNKNAKFLGLDQKIYREDLGAFKVNGPIGAIEWYRSEIPSASESRS